MKKLLFILSIASVGLLNACTEKIEPAVTPTTTTDKDAAANVAAVIQKEFPSSSNISVSTIDDKKIYGCDFSHNGNSYEAAVSATGQILSVYQTSKDVTLPDAIKAYLDATYKGYKLQKASQGKDAAGKVSYKVTIEYNDQRITMIFDDKGTVMATFTEPKNNTSGDKNKVFAAKLTDLPANIQSQLAGYEFIGAIVKTNSDNSKKTYFVMAKKDGIFYELTFDNDGKLVKTDSINPKKIEDKPLNESDLPQIIKDYIKINYKDWKYEKGMVVSKNSVTDSYTVLLSKDKKFIVLFFDADGKFLKSVETPSITLPKIEDKALAVGDIPAAIKSYLDKTYAGWTFTKGSVTFKDGVAAAYYVYITVGTDKYHVYFDKDGKFFAAKKG
ncbi:MAG: PepSY-like domain-containing protein [Arcicella sp.]|nr:PepSY-like domain-containing protein [Arcicella sp.]